MRFLYISFLFSWAFAFSPTNNFSSEFGFQRSGDGEQGDLSELENLDGYVDTRATRTRRNFLHLVAGGAIVSTYNIGTTSAAIDLNDDTSTIAILPLKRFVDPYGLFSIEVPEGFYTLRRKSKGDLPDEKTGKGRRGSSIFTAGNMAKAEVVAVERFPTRVLLEENGIEATGSLSTFPALGEPAAIAALINLRRERDKPGASNTVIDPTSVRVSSDGKELNFMLRTEIEVQKPDLLMEQYGVSRLFRITAAKASLESNDGNILAVFASALETDFNGSLDGATLQTCVDSFQATERGNIGLEEL